MTEYATVSHACKAKIRFLQSKPNLLVTGTHPINRSRLHSKSDTAGNLVDRGSISRPVNQP